MFAGPPVDGAAVASLESQGRYITRPALGMDALEKVDDDNLALETPPDPRTGATRVVLDPMEWIHRPRFLSFSHRFLLAPLDRNAYINRGAGESLEIILPALRHGIEILRGDAKECGSGAERGG